MVAEGRRRDTEQSPLEQALAGGTPQRVGWFRFHFDDQRWEWSDEVQLMHGYAPGTVTPTTELVLSHKHPDDAHQVAATLEDIRRERQPFSTRHRIIDIRGDMHTVIVIGDQLRDETGTVTGAHGFYVDITPAKEAHAESITAAVAEISHHRAEIEQTKAC